MTKSNLSNASDNGQSNDHANAGGRHEAHGQMARERFSTDATGPSGDPAPTRLIRHRCDCHKILLSTIGVKKVLPLSHAETRTARIRAVRPGEERVWKPAFSRTR